MRNVDLSRLHPGPDVWELGVVPHPHWIVEKGQPAYRPTHAWCMSRTRRRQATIGPSRIGEDAERMALLVITKMLRGCRAKLDDPSTILVRDAFLLLALAMPVTAHGVAVEQVDELPLVDAGEARFRANTFDPIPEGFLHDIEPWRLRAYSQAALEFAYAEPWKTLPDHYLVEITPAPEDMRFCAVSGFNGGTRGFGFYRSKEGHLRFTCDPSSRREIASRKRWLFSIDTGKYIPNADLDRWQDENHPRIDGRDFPLLEHTGHDWDGPGPERLTFVEAVLRGLADIGRRGIDAAHMHKIVRTHDGPVSFTMSVTELRKG